MPAVYPGGFGLTLARMISIALLRRAPAIAHARAPRNPVRAGSSPLARGGTRGLARAGCVSRLSRGGLIGFGAHFGWRIRPAITGGRGTPLFAKNEDHDVGENGKVRCRFRVQREARQRPPPGAHCAPTPQQVRGRLSPRWGRRRCETGRRKSLRLDFKSHDFGEEGKVRGRFRG